MATPHDALTLQMLRWISEGARSYAEVLDVWKSTCPRLTIWEDACADGLVDSAPGMSGRVSLTEKGRRLLSRDFSAPPRSDSAS
ncbi:hypothetical protein SAMN06265795_11912 [Noviherbaspirillum humi]|uniref:Winged helix DNA-binding domain-containing protein n=1 Tax=Noviherbaspirillum humi TaxID=1688639 RepID=A0A239L295_9BURK|nr:hypothetical protein [Noviherbaspirillum humi]SNT24686.1 hypothetical protein SAMN06265795_11912 [Noviherbaspirillum humi]